MTASTSSDAPPAPRRVPGVFVERRPRVAEPTAVRTDVAGFVGFEPRVRVVPGSARLTGGDPPTGHTFAVELAGFLTEIDGRRLTFGPGAPIVSDAASIPIADGGSVVHSVVGVGTAPASALLVAGPPLETGAAVGPSRDVIRQEVEAVAGTGRAWKELARVWVRRAGGSLWPVVAPALSPTRCDDYEDFLLQFGPPREDGALLASAVRAYFANGGDRCHVVTVGRPQFDDAEGLAAAAAELVGIPGSSEAEATGLERLLLIDEVSIIDVPDLHARRVDVEPRVVDLPGSEREACFVPCGSILGPVGPRPFEGDRHVGEPVFPSAADAALDQTFQIQKALLARCIPDRWRAYLLLSVPLMPAGGGFEPPSGGFAELWRDRFDALVKSEGFAEDAEMSCAGLYWPWVLTQERAGGPVAALPPSPAVAGVFARRDLARGPHVAPANETVREVVGLSWPIDDALHGRLADPDPDAAGRDRPAVNVLRAFPGRGVQVWGARTLSTGRWMRFTPVRRCLSAIERRMKVSLDAIVFEPNTPLAWLQVVQIGLGVLLPIYESNVLRGDRPEEAFSIRCDAGLNPPEAIEAGRLLCEVGVAVAAPAEFLVFRIGREDGRLEVEESP